MLGLIIASACLALAGSIMYLLVSDGLSLEVQQPAPADLAHASFLLWTFPALLTGFATQLLVGQLSTAVCVTFGVVAAGGGFSYFHSDGLRVLWKRQCKLWPLFPWAAMRIKNRQRASQGVTADSSSVG